MRIIQCRDQYANRDGQGTGQWIESNCSVHHLFLLNFILPSLLFIVIIITVYFDSTLKCPYLNPQGLCVSTPHQGWNEQAAAWYLSCQMRLNNNTIPELTKIKSTMEKVEVTEVYWKFHVRTLAKKLFERRKSLVHIKEYSLLVEKLHDVLRIFPDTNLSFYLAMNGLEYP